MTRKRIFTVGGTVQAGSGTYLRRAVDEELLELCREGSFSYVLTARQMGKSSLMVQTATRLHEQDVATVIIDLSQIGANVTPESWYVGLLTMIESRLALDVDAYDWWTAHETLGPTQRLVQFFKEVVLGEFGQRVVVFIDEIDTTLSLDFTDDFFAALRAMHNARSVEPAFERLSFVLIGVAMPGDLIADPKRTPFNIGHGVDVGYFTVDEAMPLAEGFDLPLDEARQVLEWVLNWTGGHPFLTQRLCAVLADYESGSVSKTTVDRAVRDTFFGDQSEKDANLRFVQDMLTRRAPDPQSVLETYRAIIRGQTVADDRQSLVISHLKLSGVVRRTGRHLQVSNRIYGHVFDQRWLSEHLPKHWIRSVPPAVRGLVAASFVAIIALGAFFFARLEANQAQRQQELLAGQNALLQASRDSVETANLALEETQRENVELIDTLQLTNVSLDRALGDARTQQQLVEQARADLQREYAVAEQLRREAETARDALEAENVVSDSLRAVAEAALEQTSQARRETLVLALSIEAERVARRGEAELAALLARRAFLLAEDGTGAFADAVLNALRQSLNALEPGAGGPLVVPFTGGAPRTITLDPATGAIMAGTEDGMVYRWEPSGLGLRQTHSFQAHDGGVRAVALGIAGNIVTAGDDGRVRSWTLQDGDTRATELGTAEGGMWSVAVDADRNRLAASGADGMLRVWALDRPGSPPTVAPTGTRIRSVAIHPTSGHVLAGGEDGVIRAWDPASDTQPVAVASAGVGAVMTLRFHPEGTVLAVGGEAQDVVLLDPNGWTEIGRLVGHEARVLSIAFDPDGHRLFSASADGTVQIADLVHPDRQTMILEAHDAWVHAVAVPADGSAAITASADRTMGVWTLDLASLADRACELSARKELTEDEWIRFVGVDLPYDQRDPTCPAEGTDLVQNKKETP